MKRFVRSLTDEEMRKLLKVIEEGKDDKLKRKVKVIFLSCQGKSISEVAKELGITKQAVVYIINQFEKYGVDEFLGRKRGRKKKFTDEQRQMVIKLVNEFAPVEFGLQKNYWTLSVIVKAMRKIYNIKISKNMVRKILKSAGIDIKAMRDRFKKRKLVEYIK